MQDLKFPLKFQFKISTLSNDFTATDADGEVVAYVRQKMFRLKEAIDIYSDSTRSRVLYTIKADRWLDFSAVYSFYDEQGVEFGKVARRGWRSLWKAEYAIIGEDDEQEYSIKEENPWAKVVDSLIAEIPVAGMLTGLFANPKYLLSDMEGRPVIRLSKDRSLFGRNFTLQKIGEFADARDDDRVMLGLMMMILLERRRG